MPWQTAPGVVIIVAAFSVSGMAIPLIHKLIKGEKRVIGRDDFDFLMAKRDKRAVSILKIMQMWLFLVQLQARTPSPLGQRPCRGRRGCRGTNRGPS